MCSFIIWIRTNCASVQKQWQVNEQKNMERIGLFKKRKPIWCLMETTSAPPALQCNCFSYRTYNIFQTATRVFPSSNLSVLIWILFTSRYEEQQGQQLILKQGFLCSILSHHIWLLPAVPLKHGSPEHCSKSKENQNREQY